MQDRPDYFRKSLLAGDAMDRIRIVAMSIAVSDEAVQDSGLACVVL
jgi:hypothetical protein